jgi:hypothetical protein
VCNCYVNKKHSSIIPVTWNYGYTASIAVGGTRRLSIAAWYAEPLEAMDGEGNQTRQDSRLDSARALRLSLVASSFVESDGQITQ